ncbi:MAG: NAD(P)-binding protein [Phenylobacterium sp.]|nr:NAD(P)-binding protein [Phenylobacterium sp.]
MTMKRDDKNLGMDRPIARRDFLAGAAVAVAASTTFQPGSAAAQVSGGAGAPAGGPDPAYYPPKLTGLRGQHVGSFEQAHQARDGGFSPGAAAADTGESYDLVVVGGGISGLSAAYFYREMMGENARILILDNHDDFGGHAKRNEFRHEGRVYLGYGGTMSIETPYPYSFTARSLIKDLGIDVPAMQRKVNKDLYKGLGRGTFFDKEHFGVDRLVVGQGVKPWPVFLKEAPLSAKVRADLLRLHTDKIDYMPSLDPKGKAAALKAISYQQFLIDHVGITPAALPFFAGQGFRNNMRVDTCPAYIASRSRAPGFAGMVIDGEPAFETEYDAHFPDGNATIARLLVNRLVPEALPGVLDADSVATARVDYAKLDRANQPVRIRLNSTVVLAEHEGDPATARSVKVVYSTNGELRSVRGANVVMACFNNIIRFIVPGLPEPQKQALAYASKVPMQYTNVFLRNWKAFKALGIQSVSAPTGYHSNFGLDIPVSMKGYDFASNPDQPIVVHMGRNPNTPGLPRKEQHRLGRMDMLATPFETIEREIRSQMARSLAGGGFDPGRDILGITVNRWPHGYSYTYDTLGDPAFAEHERPHVIGRKAFGRIAIANADAGAAAFTNEAIDQAQRAVHDCLYSRGLV